MLFLQTADAQAGGTGMMNILMIVLLIAVFYFFMIRPQQKRQKEIKKFRNSLDKGSKIMTAGGIHGVIRKVSDTTFSVEIANGVIITVDKGSVYPLGTTQEEVKNSPDAKEQ